MLRSAALLLAAAWLSPASARAQSATASMPASVPPSVSTSLMEKLPTMLRPGLVEEGGAHWRWNTRHGPIHIWLPGGYEPDRAGAVVYVHGLGNDADSAWSEHKLSRQFADSGRNALFIVPEAPKDGGEQPFWDSLEELLDTAMVGLTRAGGEAPRGDTVVVVGHSGAYRTLVNWLGGPIRHLVLLDALYGDEDEFARWIDAVHPANGEPAGRQLTVVAYDTLRWSEPFVQRFPDAVIEVGLPAHVSEMSVAERRGRVIYYVSQHGHMELVTEGKIIPMLLQATVLPAVPPTPGTGGP